MLPDDTGYQLVGAVHNETLPRFQKMVWDVEETGYEVRAETVKSYGSVCEEK